MSATKRRPAKRAALSKFLNATRFSPTRGLCYGCHHPHRKQVEADAREFARQKKAGKTALSVSRFFTDYIKPTYEYAGTAASLVEHMRKHCGIDLR